MGRFSTRAALWRAACGLGITALTAAGLAAPASAQDAPLPVAGTGVELWMKQLAEPAGFAAGDTFAAPLGFRDVGDESGQGVVLQVAISRGLSFSDSYSNCAYRPREENDLTGRSEALCVFSSAFEAGAAYTLSEPFNVKTAGFALEDNLQYTFSAVPVDQARQLLTQPGYQQGDGPELGLVPVPGADPADYTQYGDFDIPTQNAFDLDLIGDEASGRKGAVVPLELKFKNYGPAWYAALRSGGEPITFTVHIPDGASVAELPDSCFPPGEGEENFACFLSTPILENDVRSIPFKLRIDKVVPDATGKAFFSYVNPHESDPSNDSAEIELNPTGTHR